MPQRGATGRLIDFSTVLLPLWTAGSLAAGWSQAAAIAPLGGSIQELPGPSDTRTTKISTYVAKTMRPFFTFLSGTTVLHSGAFLIDFDRDFSYTGHSSLSHSPEP